MVDTDICFRQLGQLFMMGFDGTVVNDQIRTLITTYYVGSILLTAKNFECAVTPSIVRPCVMCYCRTFKHDMVSESVAMIKAH